MTKFNAKAVRAGVVTNHEGEVAYAMTPKMELYAAVVTTMMSDKFYESSDKNLQRIKSLIRDVASKDPLFVAKLAVYARNQMNLRSIPIVLATELAKFHNGDDTVSRTLGHVINRADEITELLAYYAQANKRDGSSKPLKSISSQIKRGLANAFNRFDAYQFAKYNRPGAIRLRDVLFLVRPKAKDASQQAIFDQIATDTLPTPDTWEVKLSKAGQGVQLDAERTDVKREAWEEMIDGRKMGYMAVLRNLRNFLETGVSTAHITKVAEQLSNPELVRKSKQFPFRFVSAYNELVNIPGVNTSLILEALETAVSIASENIKGFNSNDIIHVSVDTSGSMGSTLSDNSKMKLQDVGLVMAMMLHKMSPRIETSIFGDTLKYVALPKSNILSKVDSLKKYSDMVGSSTNGYLVPKDLYDRKAVVDKLVIFTDCQLYNSTGFWGGNRGETVEKYWKLYRKEVNPHAKLYIFDLAGYGNTPLRLEENGVYLIAGWSDKIFDMIQAYENGSSVLNEIEAIVL